MGRNTSFGPNMANTFMNSPKPWLFAQDLYKTGPANISSWVGEAYEALFLTVCSVWGWGTGS